MDHLVNEQDKEAKFKELIERARKGVVKHLDDKGGSLSLEEMHEYSLNTYFIQHQRFSQLMEMLVEEEFITYDGATQVSNITEKGKAFIQ